jgi:hypothetical protein
MWNYVPPKEGVWFLVWPNSASSAIYLQVEFGDPKAVTATLRDIMGMEVMPSKMQ